MLGVVRTHTDRGTLTSGERKYTHRSWRKVDRDGRHNRDSVKGFVEELWQRLFRIGEMLTHLASKHIVRVCGNPPLRCCFSRGGRPCLDGHVAIFRAIS